MNLKPWRAIARPHHDVLHGTFKQAEFAADITQVATGTAPAEYQDAEKFFARTFITEGMRLLLISVAKRLAGQDGDPVIQLQTAFGGGKTHSMLAVYHLASRAVGTDKLAGVPKVLDDAGIADLPQARVAVLDGVNLSASQAKQRGSHQVHTLWGELAWQLLGDEGYRMVESSDANGTSPGKEVLKELLEKAAPCVVLIDELVAYIRQFELGRDYAGGSFDSNISFIQALTEAMKAVPNAVLLASLPQSEVEVGGSMGLRTLETLEKYFGRVESVWKPVAATEAFEIVRRRLFDNAGDAQEIAEVCQQFSDFYRKNSTKFPQEVQDSQYLERLQACYPVHPEVFDRLYEDWSTLDKFQRTRGVLQYMAVVIHRLWNSENSDALIMPGSLPLSDTDVLNKSIHYLPTGWEPVVEREVDGARSIPQTLDSENTLFGSVQAARRCMRTVFLGSAPSSSAQAVRGIDTERILLGTAQPGQTIGTFEDALRRLRDRLHYLYTEQERYWLDTRPNLRREMESRKQNIKEQEEVIPLLKERLSKTLGSSHFFAGFHVFADSGDIPDDYGYGPRLVALPVTAGFSRSEQNQAYREAEEILRNRGSQSRQKQNRLLFLAPDFDVVSRLKEQARTYLAWRSIVSDIETGSLNQDISHLHQSKRNRDAAEQSLQQLIRETWKWLVAPSEHFVKGRPELDWEAVSISPTSPYLAPAIEQRLKEEEWVIFEWSPIHLRKLLADHYFKNDVTEYSVLNVWTNSCHYLYMPRLLNDDVFKQALNQGLMNRDYFGFASSKEGERYLGFLFGNPGLPQLDKESLFIEREAAQAYADKLAEEQRSVATPTGPTTQSVSTEGAMGGAGAIPAGDSGQGGYTPEPAMPAASKKTSFYGTVKLNPVSATMDFATLMEEVVQQFTSKLGVEVSINIEITANDSQDGFSETLQRNVRENCNVLNFDSAEFED